MLSPYYEVRRFHDAFGVDMPLEPTFLKPCKELGFFAIELEAIVSRMKKYSKTEGASVLFDRISWILEEVVELANSKDLTEQVDALADILYFTLGTNTLVGVDPDPIFDIVQDANMGKLWEDGKPRFDEQGKIIKPPNWKQDHTPEPKILAEIERQRRIAQNEKPKLDWSVIGD